MKGSAGGIVVNATGIWPPSSDCIAGREPVNARESF
jgi:hypothetical protein